jgi:hypothetical protein
LLLKSFSILKQIATKESIHTKPQKTNYIAELFSILKQIATRESIYSCSSSIEQNRSTSFSRHCRVIFQEIWTQGMGWSGGGAGGAIPVGTTWPVTGVHAKTGSGVADTG